MVNELKVMTGFLDKRDYFKMLLYVFAPLEELTDNTMKRLENIQFPRVHLLNSEIFESICLFYVYSINKKIVFL